MIILTAALDMLHADGTDTAMLIGAFLQLFVLTRPKMDLRNTGCKMVSRIQVPRDRIQLQKNS
jgi:hypothetical protein